ncbi:hypothetical protein SDC9_200975 [bioreactor metagenome]|uniref:Uncharacterized protein n=1 Tax=bioreactor metagenome TaxID=1076179 RepID=A0A645IPQ6_9ZZZZ
MHFKYIEKDPMDQVPAPAGRVILSFIGCTAIFVAYLIFWGIILTP